MIYEINTNYGGKSKVKPSVELYAVKDFTGKEMSGLAIRLTDAETLEPYTMLTKSFGEFIGIKNAAYIDTNNCPFANQLFEKGIARDTGLKKTSGRCEYPLWIFNKDFFDLIHKLLISHFYSIYFTDFIVVGGFRHFHCL